MGIVGRYIDSLSEEQKDHIVRAQRWRQRAMLWEDGARCLVGHVERDNITVLADGVRQKPAWCDVLAVPTRLCAPAPTFQVMSQFDSICDRFGTDRIVRLIKLRAGASVEDLETVSSAPTPAAGTHG